MNEKTTPLIPASQNQTAKTQSQSLEPPKKADKLSDERNKTLFRVKIGGKSTPTPASNTTYSTQANPLQLADKSFTTSGLFSVNPLSPDKSQFGFSDSTFKDTGFAQAISSDLTKVTKENHSEQFLAQSQPNEPDTPRILIFDSLKGEILGEPCLILSSHQHATVKFVIHDPDDKFRLQIEKLDNIEIELGFVEGYRKNKFVGQVFTVGRKFPDGTIVEAIDPSYSLQQTGSDAIAAETVVTPLPAQPVTATPKTNPLSAQPVAAATKPAAVAPLASKDKSKNQSLAATFAKESDKLKFESSGVNLQKQGDVQFQQTQMAAAETDAALRGNVLVASGNTLTSVAPGAGKPTGVILDYKGNRSVFIGNPIVYKRTNLHLQSGFGAITVQGWDVNNKQVIGATVVSPGEVKQHPTGIIEAPEWGSVKLGDPIFPGCPYTWADATKNGSRVPKNKEIMASIVTIAKIITQLTKESGQKKWTITSWFRLQAIKAKNSQHLYGRAVDFHFGGSEYSKLTAKLRATWPGGVAKGDGFTHIDCRHLYGGGQARWTY
ncbi:hypothetical protein FD723_39640 (plasmid) [Nostoc sp. C052]|uniref:D-Ala-D-Ala carboxypeptidase family metallohydrolase n=1 Tax=Nostoc sp. C052 TaxID=2576902 RepID=UPI001C4C1E3A|nr:D-Ala-D-Ala carboxypeptidase family metallohydrolase [Nostoc sp. C052]QLE46325.1 hypothetical protein FD723_39640 [Nostoc sp. C052]